MAAKHTDDSGLYVLLLRGINVGGHHSLPMKELVALLEGVGCAEARTYIQSGSAVVRASAALAAGLPQALAAAIEQRFGFAVPVVMRSAEDMRAVERRNPFLSGETDPKKLHVAFLAGTPSAEAIGRMDPDRSPPDRIAVVGRDIYLHTPQGLARTKFTNDYIDRQLATTATVRNWNTVRKLLEMVGD